MTESDYKAMLNIYGGLTKDVDCEQKQTKSTELSDIPKYIINQMFIETQPTTKQLNEMWEFYQIVRKNITVEKYDSPFFPSFDLGLKDTELAENLDIFFEKYKDKG